MSQKPAYQDDFYNDRHERTLYAARTLLDHVAGIVPPIGSAVDVGCGVGTWLAVLRERGVEQLRGYDGEWVDEKLLQISGEDFARQDLTRPIAAPQTKYDLAISLEVAEHLPASAADTFVRSLTGLADFILFSAAIPNQGGQHHVNEQWLEYWLERFEREDYVGLDVIRPQIWHDRDVAVWYRQNTMLLARRERIEDLNLAAPAAQLRPISTVHPEVFISHIQRYEKTLAKHRSVKGSWKLFRRVLRVTSQSSDG